jgi:hemoglobin
MPAAAAPPHDLTTEADVASVVRAFYAGVQEDPMLAPFFADVDWEHHLPRMVEFWESIVFHTGRYGGRPFDPHARLEGLRGEHFDRWVGRFHAAVDERFAGPTADAMKEKAASIAGVFRVKLGLWTPAPAG